MRLLDTMDTRYAVLFPFLFGGAFIEAVAGLGGIVSPRTFPFLFGGAFIEAYLCRGYHG